MQWQNLGAGFVDRGAYTDLKEERFGSVANAHI